MTDTTENFADSPGATDVLASVGVVDALSEILHAVRLRGDAVVRCAPKPPFNVAIPAGRRVLHVVEDDTIRLRVPGRAAAFALRPGDLALLARGDGHSIGAGKGAAVRALSGSDCYIDDAHVSAPDTPRWVTGTFAVEDALAGPLLSVLPAAIVVSAAQPGRDWLSVSLQLLLAEVTNPRPGAAVMISRILDLLFIHTLREWSAHDASSPGWLTAAMDPALAQALIAIHREPCRRWSVEELARLATLSRSTFAERFTRLLGQPPAAYATEYRLDHAADLLRSGTASVSKVAEQSGYASEAAFSRAFQRRFGAPPVRWRRSKSAATYMPVRPL
ncbi:MAG: AraC family transcriptional regulator [Gaiellaceae bacterium]